MTARRQRADAVRFASELTKARTHARAQQRALDRRSDRALSPAFVVELLEWLRDQPSSAAPVWDWLRQILEAQDDDSEEMIRREHQREAADQLAIANTITTMRLMSSLDWPVFFERVSLLERALREDPSGAYAQMDFPTRDRYRRTIELLARRSGIPEMEVGRRALDHAARARHERPDADREHHVGFYLISRGRFALEEDLGYRPRLGERLGRFAFRHPAIGYLGSIALLVTLSLLSLLSYAFRRGGDAWDLALVGLLCLIPVSELAIGVINRIFTSLVHPRPLPKLALREGIPAASRTMVVVPTMLASSEGVQRLLEDLEVRYLANRDASLHFALLTDFRDAHTETLPDDDDLVAAAGSGITQLNERHGSDRFFLLHRRRQWNEPEGLWMGWERKRGKLNEFNRLRARGDGHQLQRDRRRSLAPDGREIRHHPRQRHAAADGHGTAARRHAGASAESPALRPAARPRDRGLRDPPAAHRRERGQRGPLTVRAVFCRRAGHRSVHDARSRTSIRIFSARASSSAKGIYDVDAFSGRPAGRFPENRSSATICFEGLVRACRGSCTDVHARSRTIRRAPCRPTSAGASLDARRLADRALAVADGPGRDATSRAQPAPALSRWKILDNLRRSSCRSRCSCAARWSAG